MQYLATYGSGWEKAIEKTLETQFHELNVTYLKDGIAIFESESVIDIKTMFFFNNVYLLLAKDICVSSDFNENVSHMLKKVKLDYRVIRNNICDLKKRDFKILSINGNQPCKINYSISTRLELDIQNNLNMKMSKEKHDIDFVFLQRTDGNIYFLLKLSYNRINEKNLDQGSLRPEVAYLLSSLASIKETDIILDPFAGSGAIPKEIIKRFKYNMIFASDISEEKYEKLKSEFKNNNKHFYIKNFDALEMPFFKDDFIDVVVTDPPWNIYEHENKNYTSFYHDMLIELRRIVKRGGRIVILMGNDIEFENALKMTEHLTMKDKLSVLINGKKAKAYVIEVKK